MGIKLGKDKMLNTSKQFLFNRDLELDLFSIDKSALQPIDSAYSLAEMGTGFNKFTTASPLHASMLFAPVLNSGYIAKPRLITSMNSIDSNNSLSWSYKDSIIKVSNQFSKRALAGVKEASARVITHGTARRKMRDVKQMVRRYPDWEIGGKTGNVDGLIYAGRTDWFIGYLQNRKLGINYTISVMQVHGEMWNMHSTYIASEIMRRYIRVIEKEQKRLKKEKAAKEKLKVAAK